MDYFLKCKYGSFIFDSEYAIKFNSFNSNPARGACIVNRSDVIPLDGRNGLLKLRASGWFRSEGILEDKIWVLINDRGTTG